MSDSKIEDSNYIILLEYSPDAVYSIKGSKFEYVNPTGARILGFDNPSELIGKNALDMVHPDYRELVLDRSFARQKGEHALSRYEVKLLRKDGTTIDVEFHISTVELDNETLIISYVRNIEDRIKYRTSLKALHNHINKLTKADTFEKIINTTLEAMNDALDFEFSSILKVVDDKLVMHTNIKEYQGFTLPLNGKGLTVKAAKTQKTVLVKDTRKDPNYSMGSQTSLSELDVPVIIEGKTVAVLNVEQDRVDAFNEDHMTLLETLARHVGTAIYRIQKEKQLEEINQMHIKDLVKNYQRISSMVRHDLRSPLQAIFNASEILNVEPNNKKMRELIRNQGKYIESILNDWNNQTLNGEVSLKEENIDQLVQVAVKSVITSENIDIAIDIDEDLEFYLDYNRMLRAITNILKNSVEAMPDGGNLQVKATIEEEKLRLMIEDTGTGIPENDMNLIYDPFFTTKPKGMGLGLSFVRQVVEAHQGILEITSKPREGTTVTIKIPPMES